MNAPMLFLLCLAAVADHSYCLAVMLFLMCAFRALTS